MPAKKIKAQTETAHLNANPKNAARLQESIGQVKSNSKRKTVSLTPGSIDMDDLARRVARIQSGPIIGQTNEKSVVSPAYAASDIPGKMSPIDGAFEDLFFNMNNLEAATSELLSSINSVLLYPATDDEAKCGPDEPTVSSVHQQLRNITQRVRNVTQRLNDARGAVQL